MSSSFDNELYLGYKQIALNTLRSVPIYYNGSFESWATMLLNMINDYIELDDMEACKAIKDSFIEYINDYIKDEDEKVKITSYIDIDKLINL